MRKFSYLSSLFFLFTAVSFAQVSIGAPANGATTNSPMHFKASASRWGAAAVASMQVYVDGGLVYNRAGNTVDQYFNLGGGWHTVTVKAWDKSGGSWSKAISVKGSGVGIILSTPKPGTTVSSSTRVYAKGYSSYGISGMKLYNNGDEIGGSSSSLLDKTVSLSSGSHWLVIKAWAGNGKVFSFPALVNVGGSTGSSSTPSTSQVSIPSNAVKKTNIDQMTGWQHCDACAGIGGAGSETDYSMTQWIKSPSIDGAAAIFWLGGTIPYSNALWWKQLGAADGAKHFVYDLKFFFKNYAAIQSLEFDVNQSVNGLKYIFGTECNIRNGKGWRVWDTRNVKWVTSGKACTLKTGDWNHLTWEFERVGNQTHFIAVTVNGWRQKIDRYFYTKASSGRELNVAFQMDGNYEQADYSVWLDHVTLYYW